MSLKNVLIGTERYTRFGLIRYLLYLSQLCLTFTAANLAGGGATATYVSLSLSLSLSLHSIPISQKTLWFTFSPSAEV